MQHNQELQKIMKQNVNINVPFDAALTVLDPTNEIKLCPSSQVIAPNQYHNHSTVADVSEIHMTTEMYLFPH